MKLSEIKGTRNLEIIADIIEPLGKIAMDDRYKGVFPLKPAKDESPQTTVIKFILKEIPHLLKGHQQDVAQILATIAGIPVEEMTIISIVKGIKDIYYDSSFLELFTSAAQSEEQTPPSDISEK